MASLLVYVDAERAAALLGDTARQPGAAWVLQRDALPLEQLDRLDEWSTLFLVTVEGGRALVLATVDGPRVVRDRFESGEAIVRDADISWLVHRLGCPDVASLPAWAEVPRILPPGDVQLLDYILAIDGPLPPPVEAVRPPPAIRVAAKDEPNAYAPDVPDAAGPLAPYLLPGYEVRDGALVRCAVDDRIPLPDELLLHPTWSTVEDLATRNARLLLAPSLRALRCARIGGEAALKLAFHHTPLPIEVLAGLPAASTAGAGDRGIWLADWDDWGHIATSDALPHLRVLSVNLATPTRVPEVLWKSSLGERLRQLDLFVTLATDPDAWRVAFEDMRIPLLTLRFTLDEEPTGPLRPRLHATAPAVVVGLEREDRRLGKVIVQLTEPLSPTEAVRVARYCTGLDVRQRTIEVHDLGAPDAAEERQRALLDRLRATYLHVDVRAGQPLTP